MQPSKDRTLALVLEIVGGLFGLPGIGWLYGGQIVAGMLILGVMIGIDAAGLVSAIFTAGLSCLCSVPFALVVAGVSSYMLYNHTKQHPETFGV
jgi:TM2 domain-containing membrane protein YozV